MIWKTNPLTMRGLIDRCWLFTFQTPALAAQALLPTPLTAVTRGNLAFWNVVVCHVHGLRPKGFPPFVGLNYWHVAYRLYVKFSDRGGKESEGLYFVRSDCDHPWIARLGNMMTSFSFHEALIEVSEDQNAIDCRIASPDASARARLSKTEAPRLPSHSAFVDLADAATFLKYQPRGISVNKSGQVQVVTITRDEAAWKSRLVHVEKASWAFFQNQDVREEICYEVEPISYQWNRGACVSS